MRIAQIAPLAIRVPPPKYGGTERVIHALTEELVKRGHDVTLFASGDSITSAKLQAVFPTNLRDARYPRPYDINIHLLHSLGRAYLHEKEFDVLHDHTGSVSLPFAEKTTTPVVSTLHCRLLTHELPLYHEFRKTNLVSISHDMNKDHVGFNTLGVVYNGLDMKEYPTSPRNDGYLLYVGRICQEKGTREAIVLAKRLNRPLIIAAKIEETERGHRYYRKYVKPHLGGGITWIGEVNEQDRNDLMSRAYALVHAAPWREPFGLTLIEAMACGTPVLAFKRGSIPEIIEHSKTGFVVETLDEMVEAAKKIPSIDREYTREYALQHFSAERMADDYENLYHYLMLRQTKPPPILAGAGSGGVRST